MAAANFKYQENFDLWAGDFSIPLYPINDDGDEDTNAAPVDYLFDDYAYNEAQSKIDEVNAGLKFYKLTLEAGYYAGTQIVIDDSDTPDEYYLQHYRRDAFAEYGVNTYVLRRMIQAERKRINEVLLPLFKAYGFNKYGISARFSNGETWYSQIA